jgi:hypothetical protein
LEIVIAVVGAWNAMAPALRAVGEGGQGHRRAARRATVVKAVAAITDAFTSN